MKGADILTGDDGKNESEVPQTFLSVKKGK
jgi:hypothetical protein